MAIVNAHGAVVFLIYVDVDVAHIDDVVFVVVIVVFAAGIYLYYSFWAVVVFRFVVIDLLLMLLSLY